jgi:ADP-ribose pyrophosphatase YjhB (NUDIX family)
MTPGKYRNPVPTVDVILEMHDGRILLVERKNPPHGWALPGGFVDYGESCEAAAVREAAEETGLEVILLRQLGTYSDPTRDPRLHTITTVFIAQPADDAVPRAGDDAAEVGLFSQDEIPWTALCFDHDLILRDHLAQSTAGD